MNYIPGRDIPSRPPLPSWKHVASSMTFLYLEQGRDPPRRYTEDVVSARWNNDIRPRLAAAARAPTLRIEVPSSSPPLDKKPPAYEEDALPPYERTNSRRTEAGGEECLV